MCLILKHASFYNIEKHVNHTFILKVNHECCVHNTDRGLIAYQRIQAPFTHKMNAYKISFRLLYKEELTPYKAMNLTLS